MDSERSGGGGCAWGDASQLCDDSATIEDELIMIAENVGEALIAQRSSSCGGSWVEWLACGKSVILMERNGLGDSVTGFNKGLLGLRRCEGDLIGVVYNSSSEASASVDGLRGKADRVTAFLSRLCTVFTAQEEVVDAREIRQRGWRGGVTRALIAGPDVKHCALYQGSGWGL
jgi:hypothetical protein